MIKRRRQWTSSQKLEIVQDAALLGVTESSRKHGVASSMIYRWKHQYEEEGPDSFQRITATVDTEKRRLEREIERLRQVVADQAVTIRIKDELLKKTPYR